MIPGLNPAQNEAVLYDGHALVVAIPGSGKTRTLQEKAVHILRSGPAQRVIACTFTRDAAMELRQRILQQYPQAAPRLTVGTFHSLALLQLKNSQRDIRLISEPEQRHIMKQALASLDMRISHTDASAIIDYFKSRDPEQVQSESGFALYRAYQQVLNRHGVHDFGDLLLESVYGLRDGTVQPLEGDWLLVDEFQDTDRLQFEWIKSHILTARGRLKTMVVGDDDQSIFGFRHSAGYSGMLEYQALTGAKLITLNVNYRSRAEILGPASRLIAHNAKRITKNLVAHRGLGGSVSVRGYSDLQEEIAALIEAIQQKPQDWAVLARTNNHLDQIEAELSRLEIPYTRTSSSSFWSLEAVHAFTSLLESLQTQKEIGLEKALVLYGIRRKQIEQLKGQGGLHDMLYAPNTVKRELTLEQQTHFTALAEKYRIWRDQLKAQNYPLVMLGVCQWLSTAPKLSKSDRSNMEKAMEILCSKQGTIMQRLHIVSQLNKKDTVREGVQLMTLHGSKGLEFPSVWMLHANEGTMPHQDSLHDVSEERCLFYVGITRAQDTLVISYSVADDSEKSRFLDEAGLGDSKGLTPPRVRT